MNTIKDAGIAGQIILAIIIMTSVIFMIPSVLFTVGAGYLYGVFYGATIVVLSETLGAIIAFLIARYLLGTRSSNWLKKRARIAHVSNAMLSHGWRVIVAFRVIPFFPFKLSNYFFGLLPVTFSNYTIGTLIGLWPITLFNTYMGSITADLTSDSTFAHSQSTWQWLLYAAGFFLTIGSIIYLTRVATRTLSEYNDDQVIR